MIGGEFNIELEDLSSTRVLHNRFNEDEYLYSSGRAAFYNIISYLVENKQITSILLPDYLCDTIISIVKKFNIEFAFYPLSQDLKLGKETFGELYKKRTAVLLINYFGLVDLREQFNFIKSLDKDSIVIEDDVQSFFSFFQKKANDIDFAFTSLRKTFAIPDGGIVKTKYKMPLSHGTNTFSHYKMAGGILKSFREQNLYTDKLYLDLMETGESLIENNVESSMSDASQCFYTHTNLDFVKTLRRRNSNYLYPKLIELGITPIIENKETDIPLFIPIFLKNRDKVHKHLFLHQVYCPIHWPVTELLLNKGKEMEAHELSLVIDQRYGLKDMDYILTLLEESIHEN